LVCAESFQNKDNLMNKIISSVAAVALLSFNSLAGITPAAAAGPMHPNFQRQDRYIGDFCVQNRYAPQCRDWRTNHSRWGDNEYRSFYRTHQDDRRFGGNVAAGIFGFTMGRMLIGTFGANSDHVRACEARYRSYNRTTDRFFGYDGSFHACRL
jgi:BA14K-like protein